MLRTAIKSDLPGMIALWGESFGDSEPAVRFFFESFPDCISYVAEKNGVIVSMVHALPQTLSPDVPAAYVYAVATLKTHRGKGLCRDLMAFAEKDLRDRGFDCCVLTPGEPHLFRFYEKLGYRADFTRTRTAFSGGNAISAAAYAVLRERILTVPYMVCDLRTLEYAAKVYGLRFYETPTGRCDRPALCHYQMAERGGTPAKCLSGLPAGVNVPLSLSLRGAKRRGNPPIFSSTNRCEFPHNMV